MFSRRAAFEDQTNRLWRLLQQKRQAGISVIDLTESNPTRVGLEFPNSDIREALADPRSLAYEPAARGLGAARQAVSAYYADRGLDVAPDRLVLTASTSEAYAHLFRLLGDPGDRFLFPQPSYPLLEFLARMESVELVPYRVDYDGVWHVNMESLRSALSPPVRAVMLVNPNNPTGSFLKIDELAALQQVCRQHELALIADEVFSDYALEISPDAVASVAAADEVLTFTLSGLSKVCGLPQFKLGWIAVSGPAAARDQALEKLEWIADTFLSVGAPVQHAAGRLLDGRRHFQTALIKRLKENLLILRSELQGTSGRALRVEGGWYAVVQLPQTRSEEEWVVEALDGWDVLLHPGYFFGFPAEAFVVVSLLVQPEVLAEGAARLRKFLQCRERRER